MHPYEIRTYELLGVIAGRSGHWIRKDLEVQEKSLCADHGAADVSGAWAVCGRAPRFRVDLLGPSRAVNCRSGDERRVVIGAFGPRGASA
jgi:hypothetical protein